VRLFVAVVPPGPVVSDLAAAIAEATGRADAADDALRWMTPDTWHLTLSFYGEVGEDHLAELRSRLLRVAARHPACELAFSASGRFDRRVLWVGVAGQTERLRRIADSTSAAARRVGIPTDTQRYRPHLTVARARTPVDLRPYVERLADYRGPTWRADRLALVRSFLGQGPTRGSRYETIQELPLTGRARPESDEALPR
jgi:2'-5' RNA ligase